MNSLRFMTPVLVALGLVMIVMGFWVADAQRLAEGEIDLLKTAAQVPALLPGDVPAVDLARRAAERACAAVAPGTLTAERDRMAHLSLDLTLTKAFGMRERRALELAQDSAQDRYRLDQDSGPATAPCQAANDKVQALAQPPAPPPPPGWTPPESERWNAATQYEINAQKAAQVAAAQAQAEQWIAAHPAEATRGQR